MNRTHNNLSSSEDDFQTEGFDKKFNESNAPSGGMSTSIRTQARQIGRPQSRIDFIGRSWTQLSLRLLALIAGIIVLLIAASLPGILPAEDIECIKDVGFEITSSSNKYFEDHRSSKHAFMIICGLAMDVTVLCGLLSFVIKGKTWRLPIVMVLFYFTRMVVQKIFLMKFPEGYIWEYPGFPSLTVPYGRTNDFLLRAYWRMSIEG